MNFQIEINEIHSLNIETDRFESLQAFLCNQVDLKNTKMNKEITRCAGVDVAYWKKDGLEWGCCSVIVIDYNTKTIIEKTSSIGRITVPYIPGCLAFRELPLIIEAARKLSKNPDVFIFDGNGYLHPRHMGIATHASLFLNTPTIGVAKSYFKINDTDFKMPKNKVRSYEDIIIKNEVYGRVLRTHQNVKPIFISCGNYIDLRTTTDIILELINEESRLPIPIRLADLDTRRMRRQIAENGRMNDQ